MKIAEKIIRIMAAGLLIIAAVYIYVKFGGHTAAAAAVLFLLFGAAAILMTGDFGRKWMASSRGEYAKYEKEEIPFYDRVYTVAPPDGKRSVVESIDFESITEALAAIPKENTEAVKLVLLPGIYREKLVIDRPNITIEGEGDRAAVISWDDYASKLREDGDTFGTFRSYTVLIDTHDVTLRNVVVENTAGPVGQALALYADGDRLLFEDCDFLGYQDTIFTGPLPPKEGIPGGFKGPKEHAARIMGRQCYRNCRIAGSVDYIFGSAAVYFERCILESRLPGYITAASTPEGEPFGYVFEDCALTADAAKCPPGSVYLGRPWRDFAKTVFLNCRMGEQIHPDGWSDWGREEARNRILYAEYQSRGNGASDSSRVEYAGILTGEEAAAYTKAAVIGGTDGWNP